MNSSFNGQEDTNSAENRPKSLHLTNGESTDPPPAYTLMTSDTDLRKKSVTFATTSPTTSNSSSQISPNTPISAQGINIPGKLPKRIWRL